MALRRLLIAGALAAAVSPLIGLAQSQAPNVCETACRVEYERGIATCTGANSAACLDAAAASYKTCLSACPAR